MVRRKNPAGIQYTDGAILVGTGVVLGLLAYWAYTRWQASQETETAATTPQFTGTDASGNPTYQSVTPGGVAVFQNTTPGALGPAAGA